MIPTVSCGENVDLIIAGRFVEEKKIQMGLKGSSNKKYLFTSDFYNSLDLLNIPPIEVIYNSLGEIIVSGIEPDPALDAINSKFSPK